MHELDTRLPDSPSGSITVVAAGIVVATGPSPCDALLRASGLAPGRARRGTAVVSNGPEAQTLELAATGLTGRRLAPAIDLEIEDVTNATRLLWRGKLHGFENVELGKFAPAELRTYRFTATWPADTATPLLEGLASFLFLRVAPSA